jgi:DNA-binding transcriptional LysR family regulator
MLPVRNSREAADLHRPGRSFAHSAWNKGTNLKKIDLNLFLVFDTIYTERNLTQAARTLRITQPAVSNALSRLRKMFNDELFVRTAKGMLPTPVADSIAHNVSEALGMLNTSVLEREEFDPRSAERIYQFSMTDLAEAIVLPKLFPFFESHAPRVGLQSYYIRRHELIRSLSRGELDFAVDVPVVDDPQLCHDSLIKSPYVCVLRPGHPQAREELTLERYLSLRHIHVSSRKKGMGQVDLALLKHDGERRIQLRVQHYRVAAAVVAGTDMAMTVPRFLAQQYEMTALELPFEVPEMDLHLYWHRQADSDRSHRWLREHLMHMFQSMKGLM